MAFRAGARSAIRPRFPMRWPRCSASPSSRARRVSGVGGRRARGQGPAAGVRQLRARARCRGRSGRAPSSRSRRRSRVLATSREGLGVADEQVWRVRSLDVGLRRWTCSSSAPAVSRRAFRPSERGCDLEICRRLDGIPLAIELAASRMASMTAVEVRDRLDHRFRLLVGSRRGLERHQTLRHAVQWSYDLLDDAGKDTAGTVFGVRRRLRPRKRLRGSGFRTTTSRSWICSTRWCASH